MLTKVSPSGHDFLALVCQAREKEVLEADKKGSWVVLMRSGLVLGKSGGVLEKLIPLFKKYLGGPLSSGKQWFSWIQVEDLTETVIFITKNPNLKG